LIEFLEFTLEDICNIKQGRYLSPGEMAEQPDGLNLVPVIGGNGVLGFTSEATYTFDVPLVTCRGSQCGLMQYAAAPSWISNNAMAVFFKGEGDNYFLFHLLRMMKFDDTITGSAQPQITITNLNPKKIRIPKVEIQQSIAEILLNFDRLIETNNRISSRLEILCDSIFSLLFNSNDEDFELLLSLIPFQVAKLDLIRDELIEYHANPRVSKVENLVKRIKVPALPVSTEILPFGKYLVLEQGQSVVSGYCDLEPNISCSEDDPKFIFGDHTCRTFLSTENFSILPNTIALEGSVLDTYWVYHAVKNLQPFESYRRHWMEFASKEVKTPSPAVAKYFGDLVKPFHSLKLSLLRQNSHLVAERDLLFLGLLNNSFE
jgi:type I restriction enzyme S subunit